MLFIVFSLAEIVGGDEGRWYCSTDDGTGGSGEAVKDGPGHANNESSKRIQMECRPLGSELIARAREKW